MALKQLLICSVDDEVLFSGVSHQDAVRYDIDFDAPLSADDDDRPTLVPPPLAAGAAETMPAPAPLASSADDTERLDDDDDSPTLLPPRISGTFPVGFALKDAALRFGLGSLDESPVIVDACANEPHRGTR